MSYGSADINGTEKTNTAEDEFILNAGVWNSVFAVPSEIVDRHLRLAGGAQIKVILYLLRNCGKKADIKELSLAAGMSEGDTKDAVTYWIQAGLIKENAGRIEPSGAGLIEEEPLPQQNSASPEGTAKEQPDVRASEEKIIETVGMGGEQDDKQEEKQPKPKKREKVRYSYEECVDMINDTPELREMLGVLEGILSKQLNHTEIAVFVSLVRYYGLPAACVALLVEYCRSIGKSSIAYIEQTGIGWSREEIYTVEQADAKIKRMRMLSSSWKTVRDTLGIPERSPSETEQRLSAVWIEEWQLAPEMIKLAYDRCVDAKGKLSFSYMNGIIKRWHEQGLGSAEEIVASEREGRQDKSGKTRDNGRYAPTYDISEIEKLLDEEWAGGENND